MSAISANLTSGPYLADGSQRAFPFNFSIASDAEISVLLDGAVVSKSLYTVAFGDLNGTVTFNAPPVGGAITLLSSPDFEQASTFESQGAYTLDTVNKINRRAAIRDLVTKDSADRALKLPLGGGSGDLPALTGAEGKVLGYVNGHLTWVANDSAGVEGAVDTALAAAAEATDSKVDAAAAAISAESAADRAETARDAASISAGLYVNETTGRAAVANSVVFLAVGTTNDKAVDVWQRVNSSSSTLLRSYPSLSALTDALTNFTASMVAAASAPYLLGANRMGFQRTVPPSDLSNGYGTPTFASNGQVTYGSGGVIQGSLYYLTGPEIVRRDAGLAFTARLPVVSGAPASARLIQFNAANTEVGTRPTAVITASEVGFHGVVLNAATIKLRLEVTTSGSVLVTTFMAVSMGEPATVSPDALYNEATGYLLEQLNEAPLISLTYTFAQQGTTGTFVGGVLSQPANPGAASGLQTNNASFVVGGKYRLRFRSTSRLLVSNPSTTYIGDPNGFSWPALIPKINEIPGDSSHVFYDFEFTIPAHPTVPAYPLAGISIGFYSPTEAVVCDDFIAAADFQLPLVRKPPRAVRTYISDAIVAALAAGGPVLSVPTAAVDLWGDSLTDFGHAAGAPSDQLATYIGGGVTVRNLGVATQNAGQIAARAGGSPPLLTLVSNAIPAATTAIATTDLPAVCPITGASNSVNGTDPLAGTLGGIPGVLTSVRAGAAVIGLTFTRTTAGSIVPIAPNTPFFPTAGEETKSRIQVLVWGKNDVGGTGGTTTGGAIADLIDRQVRTMTPVNKQFLVGSVLHSNNDAGSIVIDDINAVLKTRFPRYYVDLTRAPSTEEMATLSFVPNADDVKDMDCAFTGSITGSVLNVTSVATGVLAVNKTISGTDPATGIPIGQSAVITSLGTGTGGAGTYNLAISQTVPSIVMTALGFIPRGMRSGGYSGGVGVLGGDQLHLNVTGNTLWALRMYRAMKQRGYNIP